MNSKADLKYKELVEFLKGATQWHLVRVKFTAMLICSILKLQTSSLKKLAQAIESDANYESRYKRCRRFLSDFVFDLDMIARFIFKLLPIKAPYKLAMDRSNWKFGQSNINILMICVCYEGVGIPLIWMLLDKRGNSNYSERRELLQRYVSCFGASSIESFTADREFIGKDWFDDLITDEIPFYIRIKKNMNVKIPNKGTKKAFHLFRNLPLNEICHYSKKVQISSSRVYLTGIKTLDNKGKLEFVIIASYQKQTLAAEYYKDRWQIETMFKAMKSSGFNIEVTHITKLDRISKLIAVIAIAFIWAYKTGVYMHQNVKQIRILKHKRREYSFFKYGLIHIACILLNTDNSEALNDCIRLLSST